MFTDARGEEILPSKYYVQAVANNSKICYYRIGMVIRIEGEKVRVVWLSNVYEGVVETRVSLITEAVAGRTMMVFDTPKELNLPKEVIKGLCIGASEEVNRLYIKKQWDLE